MRPDAFCLARPYSPRHPAPPLTAPALPSCNAAAPAAGVRRASPSCLQMAPAMHPGMMMSALHGMPAMQAEPMAKPASKPKKVKKEEPPPEPVERPKRARKAPKKQEDYEVFKDDEGDERLDPE